MTTTFFCRGILTSLSLALVFQATAADWPQYRGSRQDGISTESPNLKWPAAGPKVLWKIPSKNGFSSFAVSDGKAFTQVLREADGGRREVLVALDASTGKELWFADIGVGKYDSGGDSGTPENKGGDGPRSTPSVNDGKVYVYDQFMVLSCFDAQTGKKVWSRNVAAEHGGRNIGWKSAMSPAVDGGLVFVAGGGPGQSMLAFSKVTGQLAWKTGDERITHSTPVVATIHGVRQVIYFMQSGLVSVAMADGKPLWRFPFRYNVSTAISPVVSGDVVYCSAGYSVGGGACRIAKNGDSFSAQELWKIPGDSKVANHWSTPVVKDGHLYGNFSFKKYGVGPLKCVELATGEIKWEKSGFGAGNVIMAGDKVIALTDDGQVVIVEATPSAYKEVARAKVLEGKCWSTPSLSGGRLYVRSTKEAACLDVSGK